MRARVVKRISTQLGGKPYAPSKANSHRITLTAAVNWAVATGVLATNPLKDVRREALPRITVAPIDMRRVANPWQVRTLLEAVREQKPSGRILYAYYACHYFAVMRPEEVAALTRANLALPAVGWGKVYLDTARPIAGKDWTDSGEERDERQLKGRRRGEGRTAPCPPELTAILHGHLGEFGVDEHGRLFRGALGGQLHHSTVQAVWDRARAEAFTPEVYATPLAETPYDLRHAGVSAWLNEGVSPTRVASWAGHSLEILYKVYAASLDGSEARDRALVERALGHGKGR